MRPKETRALRGHEVVEELAPHWVGAAIGAATAIASAAAAARQGAKTRRNTRNAAALSSLPGGSAGSEFSPTALSPAARGDQGDLDKMGLKDLLSGEDKDKFSLFQGNELKPMSAEFSAQSKPGGTDADFHIFSGDEIRADLAAQSMGQPPPADQQQNQPPPSTTGLQTNDYLSLASTLGGLASTFAKGNGPPAGGGIPQPGQMNFQPTALAQLARRRGY